VAGLDTKIIKYVGNEVDFTSDVILQNDGQGDYIKEWNLEKAKPTQEQLDALETQADEYEQNLITSKQNNKASAKQKLQDLGLTVDEIKEAFGI
jgi:RPA family protein